MFLVLLMTIFYCNEQYEQSQQCTLVDSKSNLILPSVDVITPRESVFPEQEPGVASQGAKHEEDAGDDPG